MWEFFIIFPCIFIGLVRTIYVNSVVNLVLSKLWLFICLKRQYLDQLIFMLYTIKLKFTLTMSNSRENYWNPCIIQFFYHYSVNVVRISEMQNWSGNKMSWLARRYRCSSLEKELACSCRNMSITGQQVINLMYT